MKDLSGMPTKTYRVKRLEPNQLRKCWKSNYIVIAKANKEFKNKFITGKYSQDVYCNLMHCVDLNSQNYWFQFKNYSHTIDKKKQF